MAKVFGRGNSSPLRGDSGSSRPLPSPAISQGNQTQAFSSPPNVYSGPSCAGDGGVSKVLPTSSEALQGGQTQGFSSTPSVYSKAQSSIEDSGLQDFYTKSEVQKLLRVKADISSVYTKDEVDATLNELEAEINQSLLGFITESEVDTKISTSYDSIFSYLSQNYYTRSQTYSKTQVDSLIAAIEVGDEFVMKQPATTADNTISPGTNNAIPLTLVASTNSNISTIQHWVDSQSNSVGRVRTSGRVEFYGHMLLGQSIESWRPALDVNTRRIAGLAYPVHPQDAVSKSYMEGFVVETIDNIIQGEDESYLIDALEY